MIRRSVVYSPEARDDLLALYDWIAEAASPLTAERYLQRVSAWLGGFDVAAERGTRRDERPAHHRLRAAVAFTVSETTVVILRLFYAGQDWATAFEAP